MADIEVVGEGIVYRPLGAHAYFPCVVRLYDCLIVSMDVGMGMEGRDVRAYTVRSNDGGSTWSEPRIVHEPSCDGATSTLCRISQAPDGGLIAAITLLDRAQGEGLANALTDGYVDTSFTVSHSEDGGETWSEPAPLQPATAWKTFETCSPILAIDDRLWLLPTSLFRNWAGDAGEGLKAVAMRSTDGGNSWLDLISVFDFTREHVAAWEQKQVVLEDGRIFAICWAYDMQARVSLQNRYTFSCDGGATYGTPRIAPLQGETCAPLALPGGHLLCVYRRTDVKGLWAHLARLDGETWQPGADTQVWGTAHEAYGRRTASVLEEMATLQFGYPSLTLEKYGDVFGVFWCVEEGTAQIRWFRLRIVV